MSDSRAYVDPPVIEPEVLTPLDPVEVEVIRPRGRPWRPGESGNPSGRPGKDRPISLAMIDKLAEPCEFDTVLAEKQGRPVRTWAEVLVDAAFKKAAQGDGRALQEILNRVEGKPKQPIQVEGEVMHDVQHTFELNKQNSEYMKARLAAIRERMLTAKADPVTD